jgi:hypothetical protein
MLERGIWNVMGRQIKHRIKAEAASKVAMNMPENSQD